MSDAWDGRDAGSGAAVDRVTVPDALGEVAGKVAAGTALDADEAAALVATHDLPLLGMLADEARRRWHGDRVTFVRVVELATDADPGRLSDLALEHAGEVRLVGAPGRLVEARGRVADAVAVADGIPVSGFSLSDLESLAAREGVSLGVALAELRGAGLELLAEAPIDGVAALEAGLEELRLAGFGATRVTVRDAPQGDPLTAVRRVVALQQATGAVRAFAPLPSRRQTPAPSTGYDDVKQVALARLLAHNIESIQVDWALDGPKLAQVALTFGADDVDRVSASDRPELGPRRAPLEELRRNVRAASLVPVERNGRFEIKTR